MIRIALSYIREAILNTSPTHGGVRQWDGKNSVYSTDYRGFNSIKTQYERSGNESGFTVIELLIVMAIFVTISAITIPYLISAKYQAQIARAVADITAIETDIVYYESVNGVLPDSLSQTGDDVYVDPWGNPYQYLNHASVHGHGQERKDRFLVPLNSDYDLYSMGADGQSVGPITAAKSQDDIIRASNGAYVGLASQF